MKLSIFTLADYVTTQNGKLIIVGSFDQMSSDTFPFNANPFGVALKWYVEKEDYGRQRDINVEIRSQKTNEVVFEVGTHMEHPSKASETVDVATLQFMIRLQVFPSPGIYIVECKEGKKSISKIELDIKKTKPVTAKRNEGI